MNHNLIPATAAFFTLGCKLNFSETSSIAKLLDQRGISRALPSQHPDLCIVNTCSVTEMANKKGRHLIRKIHAMYPEASIIVTGCYAQLKPMEIAQMPGVDIILGSNEKLAIAEYLDQWLTTRKQCVATTPHLDIREFKPSCERGDRTRFWLKVQDGCDYYCTYCTIPMARGRSRSGSVEQMCKMAEDVARQGGKEIVITGVNTGDFGRGTDQSFFDLIRALDKIEGIERYRISSIEPNLLTDEIIEWIAHESRAFMPHFHIPLQSGSDAVLKIMNRRYDTGLFAEKIEKIRREIPNAFIGVDIIAGARGESAEQWQRSFDFAESLDVTRYHVFPYSERPGTKALDFTDVIVDQAEKHRRVALLNKLSDAKLHNFLLANLNSTRPVLWESKAKGSMMHGLTDNYIRVEAPLQENLINTISDVRLNEISDENADIVKATII